MQTYRPRRIVQLGVYAAAMVLGSRPGITKPPPSKGAGPCASAYKDATTLAQAGLLLEARRLLKHCARSACGSLMRNRCLIEYVQIQADVPSVIPTVTDDSGARVVDVRVMMDGAPLTSRIDGHALPINPGLHEFSFERNGVVATEKLVISQGERNRPISTSLPRPPQAEPEPIAVAPEPAVLRTPSPVAISRSPTSAPSRRSAVAPALLVAIGAVGLAGGALLTYWGRQDNDALAQCSPDCPASSVTHIRQLYLASDIAFGIGGAAAVAGTVWLIARAARSKKAEMKRSPYSLVVQPISSGGLAAVSGAF
jgi:hypothetical protein